MMVIMLVCGSEDVIAMDWTTWTLALNVNAFLLNVTWCLELFRFCLMLGMLQL